MLPIERCYLKALSILCGLHVFAFLDWTPTFEPYMASLHGKSIHQVICVMMKLGCVLEI